MSDDSFARRQSATPTSVDADYDAIHSTIVATERGRWFLDEYANRHRGADTGRVLDVLARIESAVRGGEPTEPAEGTRSVLADIAETIRQARGEVIGRHGDPAASGEAALTEFHNAAEQILDLVWAVQTPEARGDLGTQLAFQTNRLVAAGDRLENAIVALRVALGVLDDVEQSMRRLANLPEPAHSPEPARALEPVSEAPRPAARPTRALPAMPSLAEWTLPGPTPPPAAVTEPDAAPPLAGTGPEGRERAGEATDPEPLWDMTRLAEQPAAASHHPASDVNVTDWAFAPAEPEPASAERIPPADIVPEAEPSPQAAATPVSALDRLEAREYGRRRVETAVASPPEDLTEALTPSLYAALAPASVGFDDLIENDLPGAGTANVPPASEPEPAHDHWVDKLEPLPEPLPKPLPERWMAEAEVVGEQWTVAGPEAELPSPEAIFDADLFDAEERQPALPRVPAFTFDGPPPAVKPTEDAATARPEPTGAAMFLQEAAEDPIPGCPQDAPVHDLMAFKEDAPPAITAAPTARPAEIPSQNTDTPSVLERLDNMRTAIAALMDEVSEKKARRTPPA